MTTPDDDLLTKLLAKPVGPSVAARPSRGTEFTHEIEVGTSTAEVTMPNDGGVTEGTALAYLQEEGQNPDDWELTHFRKLKWGDPGSQRESVKFSFKRKAGYGAGERPPLDDLLAEVKRYKPRANRPTGEYGAIVALGDMQFGKIDGDGVEGTLNRTIDCLNMAADAILLHRKHRDIGHVHVAWLGDHVEGFSSQGGANVFRTPLTMNEQIRLVRRVMMHAVTLFAPLAERVSMAAVPGNHGEPQRFMGGGTTRYDDSHDTEALIAVSEACAMNEATFGHVKFLVPDTDELTVVTEIAGTKVAHAHGHKWRPGKHFDYWRGQSFHSEGLQAADLMLAGHLHHLLVEDDGDRRFIQVPSLESESTWYRHAKGTTGNPGIVLALTKDGKTNRIEVIQ